MKIQIKLKKKKTKSSSYSQKKLYRESIIMEQRINDFKSVIEIESTFTSNDNRRVTKRIGSKMKSNKRSKKKQHNDSFFDF
jgi:hypothetical protein